MESGEWRVESGKWKVESGKWKVESEGWRVKSEELGAESKEGKIKGQSVHFAFSVLFLFSYAKEALLLCARCYNERGS